MSEDNKPDTPMTVEERLAYLEEQNEGLKKVGKLLLALSLLTAGLLAWTQMTARTAVHSEALILGGDTPRGALTTSPNGHLAYLFFDHLGIIPPSPKFGAIPYLDGVVLYDRQGNPRIVMGVNDKDEAILDVVGPDGKRLFSAVPRSAASPKPPATGANPSAPPATGPSPSTGATPSAPPATGPSPSTPVTP
jgi:hypothetical protein